MATVAKLTFNPFQENTYIVYDNTKECIIIDPGCLDRREQQQLSDFITDNGLKPVRLLNTHCHLDHVFGNAFVNRTYNLGLEIPEGELVVLNAVPQICSAYGLPYPDPSPQPSRFISEEEPLTFGNTQLKVLVTPGHSPASYSFYCEADQFIIAGDVLFYESIGRTDLPGGNHATLIDSIQQHFMSLEDEVKVYPGHGPATTVGHERKNNPFF